VSGVVGETIFEEEDDSDEKTPVMQELWTVGAGKPLSRPGSAQGRMVGNKGAVTGTWHGLVKKESVTAEGVDWRDDGVRRRKAGVV
jgi:hypothetical protein